MNLDWQMGNPAVALEKYYEDVDSFARKKMDSDDLEKELGSKQSEFSSQTAELEGIKSKLSAMGSEYKPGDVEGAIREKTDDAQRKIDNEAKKFETKKRELADSRDNDISINDQQLKDRLAQLFGNAEDGNRELTEAEKKALEFEIARRKFVIESNKRINEHEDAISEEQLACQTLVGELKAKQDAIQAKFEPDITKFKKQIDAISRRYQPDIRSCQSVVSEKIANRDEEIGQLQNERNREIQLANNEIEGYQREFKQTEKQFNEQIRMAKLQSKPTTRMENSKVSRLNGINDKITKINNRANKKVSSIDQKIDVAQSKHAKLIEKAESQLDGVIRNRDQELAGPTKAYNGLIQDRDAQIALLQGQIDERENECQRIVSTHSNDIENERKSQLSNNAAIDQQILEFVMSGDTCFSDVLNEQNAPFIELQSRINTWMEIISSIKKNKVSSQYPVEHDKQKSILASKTYPELQNELSEAKQYDDKVNVLAKNNGIIFIIGLALAALGVVLFAVLKIVLGNSVGIVGIIIAIVGLGLSVLTVYLTKKEFSKLCKYVALASDYEEFPSIASQSTKITQDRELARMKALGDQLYDVHYGKAEAKQRHDEKDADIKSDYERNIKLATKEYENKKAQIERERDSEIGRIRSDAEDGEARYSSEKEDLQSQANSLNNRLASLNARINELKQEIDNNQQFFEAFESNYRILEDKLQNDDKWLPSMNDTHGKLNNALFIVPESGDEDEFHHRSILKIYHNKKAFVVNYDVSDIDAERTEEINKVIRDLMFDLMYAVYRMNSKESYRQVVVDEMSAVADLKSTNVKNAFNINEVVGKVEDIKGRIKSFAEQRERFAEKGTTIDEVNEAKFKSQDRPEVYNILYIIYKPNERKSKLDDDIRMLIPECDKYGFLPIFVCERETWEKEVQEKESMYKEIKGLASGEVVVFDGKKYSLVY